MALAKEYPDYEIFYFSKKTCGYSLEVSHRGASNDYPQHKFL